VKSNHERLTSEPALKKILVLCPTRREYRDLPAIAEALGCEVVFDEFCGDYFDRFLCRHPPTDLPPIDILALIENSVQRYKHAGLSGVTSGVGYPGMSVVSIIARKLGLPGPAPASVLSCEHKYYSRRAQQRLVPEAVPEFRLLDPENPLTGAEAMSFPLFLKPVKSCMSINAHRVDDAAELVELAQGALLPSDFIKPFNDMLKAYTSCALDGSYLIAESLLRGSQVSLEGYVYRGDVHVMGILDAVMFPESLSFRRFQYPSRLSESVQRRMAEIARKLMTGIGYDNAPFNIELFYDPQPDRIHIIEVNPKIASQFADLFEKVDGQSSFSVLLQLAIGEEPCFEQRKGEFRIAASCVLRTFEDKHVVAIPSQQQVAEIVSMHPEARIEIHATSGRNLSDQMQDAQSFRYGLVHIGAASEREIEDKFTRIASGLHFELAPVHTVAPVAA
jgi:biotin carboxylase